MTRSRIASRIPILFNLTMACGVCADAGARLQTVQGLKSIPGIGDYTAGAIASIAFGQRVPLVDGNVVRVLARLRMLSLDPKAQAAVKQQWDLAGTLVRQSRDPASLNQAYPFAKVNLDIAACGV